MKPYLFCCLLICCGAGSCTPDPAIEGAWSYALDNAVPDANGPFRAGIIARSIGTALSPGGELTVGADSVRLNNPYTLQQETLPWYAAPAAPTDSTDALVLELLDDDRLAVMPHRAGRAGAPLFYNRGGHRRRQLPYGQLTDQTFRVVTEPGDTTRVYFGEQDDGMGRAAKGQPQEYYHDDNAPYRPARSRVENSAGMMFYNISQRPMRWAAFFIPNRRNGFGADRYVYTPGPGGTVHAHFLRLVDEARYVADSLTLTPAPPLAPAGMDDARFADLLSSGVVTVDADYPRVDSADVRYYYERDFFRHGGLERDELDELEFSLTPGGEFLLVVRDRIITEAPRWRLSPGGHFVLLETETGNPREILSVIDYPAGGGVRFRQRLLVKTREPRGVKLESYAPIDAVVTVRPAGT